MAKIKRKEISKISYNDLTRMLGSNPAQRKILDNNDREILIPFLDTIREKGEELTHALISGGLDPSVDYSKYEKPKQIAGVMWGREESKPQPNEEKYNTYHMEICSIPGDSNYCTIVSTIGLDDEAVSHWASQSDIENIALGEDSIPNEYSTDGDEKQ